MVINDKIIDELLAKAAESPRLRQNLDLRTSAEDGSQRMLNALLPGTEVPVHRHTRSNENVLVLRGALYEVMYDAEGKETQRYLLDASTGNYGFVVPQGEWHTVEVISPAVIYEAKDGRYGQDGTEMMDQKT